MSENDETERKIWRVVATPPLLPENGAVSLGPEADAAVMRTMTSGDAVYLTDVEGTVHGVARLRYAERTANMGWYVTFDRYAPVPPHRHPDVKRTEQVTFYTGEDDVPVVQIDTRDGAVRVNVNDGELATVHDGGERITLPEHWREFERPNGQGPWVVTEVNGGVAEVEVSDGVTSLFVDWDEIGNNSEAAEQVLDKLNESSEAFPAATVRRIRETVEEIWPDLATTHANIEARGGQS